MTNSQQRNLYPETKRKDNIEILKIIKGYVQERVTQSRKDCARYFRLYNYLVKESFVNIDTN